MSEKNKDIAEYIEIQIKHETNKLKAKFIADLEEYYDNDYCLDSLIEEWKKEAEQE